MSFNTGGAVPFEISEVDHGLKKAEGLLKLWEQGLEFEFEVTDAFVGMYKSGVKTVRISYGDLESIQFDKGWFGAKIVLEGDSMKVFEEIPGTEVGTCTLKIKRKDRKDAQDLISKARMHHSEYKLNQMDEDE
ncbi:MAG TPA: hypothetical protein VE868_01470 [Balneolaceae bacterium]|nr:hypothetical protein [Balneolaceae bacterium]